jgi:polar amino acid transport system permease protein
MSDTQAGIVVPPLSELELGRRRYRQRQARRSTARAAISTVVVVVVLAVAVTHTPGWARVKAAFFDTTIGWNSVHPILDGLWLNIRVLFISYACIVVLALIVASVRTLRGPVF